MYNDQIIGCAGWFCAIILQMQKDNSFSHNKTILITYLYKKLVYLQENQIH